ncbi:HpcH/HpaI aldolase/citrate lyase family protein [Sphingomonas alpina]|uniref:CoA ester lyase n=1 Tax=Sphingomonas alpina TaxID=653931 RepID=A0A7H0LKG2_9SPHN|nr:CoA ester lyase [Sphingomonas alpina]QNQ10165.1 CoA ester lyase [Sphingomonas alpina]
MTRPRRSLLYMPASNLRAIEKARDLPCDAVVLDLEDAVAPEAKAAARETALAVVREGGFGRRELIVRANGLDTPWGRDDLAALAIAGPDAILVPKVNDAAEVAAYDALIAAAPAHTGLWAMIETARAMFRLEEIAAQARTTRLSGWVMGTNDLAKEMRATLDVERVPFLGFLAQSVAAARAYGLTILDGVFNAIDDDAGLEAQCRQGRAFGFDGKTLIHPKQIGTCNRVFTPSDAELAAAQAVVAAFALPENADKGALRVDGRMVERLHLAEAEAMIALRAMTDASGTPAS